MVIVVVLFGVALTTFSAWVGLAVGDPETVQAAVFIPMLPLVFTSSAFAPVAACPGGCSRSPRPPRHRGHRHAARPRPRATSAVRHRPASTCCTAALALHSLVDPPRGRVHRPRRPPLPQGLNLQHSLGTQNRKYPGLACRERSARPPDRDVRVAGDVRHVAPAAGRLVDLEPRPAACAHLLDGDAALHAGERGAEAAVHAVAEADGDAPVAGRCRSRRGRSNARGSRVAAPVMSSTG